MLDQFFKLGDHDTTVRRELIAGLTTFLTMAYIIAVHPNILAETGMDKGALITVTALKAVFGTLLMGLWINVPLAMAPGMGLNAFFAYTLVIGQGISWQTALGVVFISGLCFLILSFFGFRRKIVSAIPRSLRIAIPGGIGLFITFIGMQNMGLVVYNEATLVGLGSVGLPVVLGLLGLAVMVILEVREWKGAILIGILFTTGLGILLGDVDLPRSLVSPPPSIAPVAFQLDILSALQWGLVGAIFSFMFVDLFDSVGTIIACSYEAELVEEDGSIHNISKMLGSDAIATTCGALLGTSTTTTYIESASGIEQGGRTGLTAVVVALLFLVALVFTPVINIIPGYATAPALIIVGLFMFQNLRNIDLKNLEDAVPAFLTIILMPLTYSISMGLTFGFLSFILIKLATGHLQDISYLMWSIGLLSGLNLILTM
ncbi:NCS2 family permease [Fodinibius sediminis]|uniref:Putative MFS transporter, AGZA family, xanthine/uracil permease n=1 Tax=Fodinibius sediminis TaxID=1214077 RepID=A0A521E3H7_9BACT|nr:NCS2 family permease [Fodinibius sediminis]SMO78514.1 putative MFS transporter, AGZA family, xanthine/uracil permease [Fodinibius sediminis]